jgi:hypothetical protein
MGLSGRSDPSERSLQATVRGLLASGLLPPIKDRVWSGQGTWKCCVVCCEPIMADQLQVEPDGGPAAPCVAHVPCFLAWCDESNAVHGDRQKSPTGKVHSPRLPASQLPVYP